MGVDRGMGGGVDVGVRFRWMGGHGWGWIGGWRGVGGTRQHFGTDARHDGKNGTQRYLKNVEKITQK